MNVVAERPGPRIDVLFTGHAPVHYACFQPLAKELRRCPGVRVHVSGGLRTETDDGNYLYDAAGLYQPFGVPAEEMRTVDEIRDMDFAVVFAANTKFLRPRSQGASVQIFHGISFRNKAIRGENMGADYYFLVGPYMRRRFVENGLMEEGDPRGLSIGFPKTDRLVDGSLDRAELLARHQLDPSLPVVLFAPTGQRYNSLETMGEAVLRELSAAGDFQVVLKPHDHAKKDSGDLVDQLSALQLPRVTIIEAHVDVVPLLYLADLLITDASSVSSEYSLLDRPMVFLDVPELLRKAESKEGAFDLATWGRRGGDLVERPDGVVAAVRAGLESPERHGQIRRSMASDLFFNPGNATREALSWFKERLGVAPGPKAA